MRRICGGLGASATSAWPSLTYACLTYILIRKILNHIQSKLNFSPLFVHYTSDPLRTHSMADDRSSAAYSGDTDSDDDWASLLHEAEPDDVEEVALRIMLSRLQLDQGESDSG